MAIMIKIVKNKQLYFDAIIPCNNFIQTIFPQNQTANNEIIFSLLPPSTLHPEVHYKLRYLFKKIFKN